MFLGGFGLSLSSLGKANSIPIKKTYSKVTVYGNSIIDKLHIKNVEETIDNLLEIDISKRLVWDDNTIAMAEYDNTLGAGSILGLNSNIINWDIGRREVGSSVSKILTTLDYNNSEYIDYTTITNKNYIYDIYPITETEIGSPLESDVITPMYNYWYLIDETDGTTYKLYLNFDSGSLKDNVDMSEFETYSKFNAFSFGKRSFIRGTLTCIIGEITPSGELDQTVEYVDNLRAFINNGKQKILKSSKGDIWRVVTSGLDGDYMDEVASNPNTLTFNFVQVGEV
jgi:hypothetical protein